MSESRIRSLLFVPGSDEAKARKAIASEADAVILDLEDAVPPAAKAAARKTVRTALDQIDRVEKRVFVRINSFDTELATEDLAAVIGGRPWGIVLPKSLGIEDLVRLGHYLDALEVRDDVTRGSTRILTIATESAAATLSLSLLHGNRFPRLWGMMWGSEDLAASLGAHANRDAQGNYLYPYQHARNQCLYAARACGVTAVDAVWTDFRNLVGLELETREALRDGFLAKAAIHPAQVPVINRVMSVSGAIAAPSAPDSKREYIPAS